MKLLIPLLIIILTVSCTSNDAANYAGGIVTSPPKEIGIDDFYKKYTDANGFPVVGSRKVPDEALLKARDIIIMMTKSLPQNVLDTMRNRGVRIAVMARYEGTTDLPEHRFLLNDTAMNWDVRARGLGGIPELPLTTCAEENLLCYQIDKYHAEDILVHEFAHTIHLVGLALNYPDFNANLQMKLDAALSNGKWDNTYAAVNIEEYWAEGVQSWFNANAQVPKPDGKHNQVNNRKKLKKYDRNLYDIISVYFSHSDNTCSCHSNL